MRALLLVAAGLCGCATFTPEQIAQHRRELTAPRIGCAEVDVFVPPDFTRQQHDWIATCRGEQFHCRADLVGAGTGAAHVQTTCERYRK